MPIAGGLSLNETERVDLKTCPGGYVVIKRLSYGDKMLRRNLLGKTTVHGSGSRTRGKRGDFVAEMQLINEQVTLLEFSKCIVEHNLTVLTRPGDTSSEVPVDFSNPVHVRLLDGVVGEEIDDAIMDLNNFEDDEEVGKSSQTSTTSSLPTDQLSTMPKPSM